ncbi:MAG: biotin carboxylase N-terminal domain-containing protein [Pseudomonadota bacterium]
MFSTVLIANRGEIAVRIARTARRLGVRTVAVYSDADRDAQHVAEADVAVRIGGAKPSESYLRGDAIIAAAQATGAEAIHPGYGFLSENPEFVEAVEAAGLVFIGPSAKAIRAMGLKDAAKDLMEAAGVPVVPGYRGADQSAETLSRAADDIGYPVLIKAVAGGGGKGMRRVDAPAGFADALTSARSEAEAAFGNGSVLVEKFVATPRHIEVQVFGDGARAVHLFERDCSLQRRHQKVIEEAPAPGMTEEVREAMGQAAVRAAEAIGYAGAGTVEFIVDATDGLRPDGFWFMEMNTRLQVEHPVTEAVTGLDLVELQLRVAAGEPLPLEQADIRLSGHAVEARLYAEDPASGFLPATGRLDHLAFPQGARVDAGVRAGDAISPHYDPMIAKIITHGPTRGAAIGTLTRALAQTQVAGLTTNLSFLRRLSEDAGFRAGAVHTGLIEAAGEGLLADPVPCERTRALAAVGRLGLDRAEGLAGFTLWAPLTREVWLGDERLSAQITGPGQAVVDGIAVAFADGWWLDGAKTDATVVTTPGRVSVFWGNGYHFDIPDPLARADDSGDAGNVVTAPMPGQVKALFVAAGDTVEAGAKLAVFEAMKMEHTLTAARHGSIAEVLVAPGAQVEAGAAILRLEDDA